MRDGRDSWHLQRIEATERALICHISFTQVVMVRVRRIHQCLGVPIKCGSYESAGLKSMQRFAKLTPRCLYVLSRSETLHEARTRTDCLPSSCDEKQSGKRSESEEKPLEHLLPAKLRISTYLTFSIKRGSRDADSVAGPQSVKA